MFIKICVGIQPSPIYSLKWYFHHCVTCVTPRVSLATKWSNVSSHSESTSRSYFVRYSIYKRFHAQGRVRVSLKRQNKTNRSWNRRAALSQASFLVCSSSCLYFCNENFPPNNDRNILATETELGLFRRMTLVPLKQPLSWTEVMGSE